MLKKEIKSINKYIYFHDTCEQGIMLNSNGPRGIDFTYTNNCLMNPDTSAEMKH